mmetsp:Transcript_99535/g.259495  ORF Transcript_99535/g.259495 Transcript_99535/m.259495 type:complete len:238 (+) Transcript_99535:427-1140(+)
MHSARAWGRRGSGPPGRRCPGRGRHRGGAAGSEPARARAALPVRTEGRAAAEPQAPVPAEGAGLPRPDGVARGGDGPSAPARPRGRAAAWPLPAVQRQLLDHLDVGGADGGPHGGLRPARTADGDLRARRAAPASRRASRRAPHAAHPLPPAPQGGERAGDAAGRGRRKRGTPPRRRLSERLRRAREHDPFLARRPPEEAGRGERGCRRPREAPGHGRQESHRAVPGRAQDQPCGGR